MAKKEVKRVTFERLDDGSWEKIADDPDDPEFEYVTELSMNEGYEEIKELKARGWKVRALRHFEGFVLEKPPEKPFKFPKEWANLKSPNKAVRVMPSPEKRPYTRQRGEVAFRMRGNVMWEEVLDDPENPELEIVNLISRDKALNKIENMKRHKWKVYHDVDLGFMGFVLYKEKK